MRRMERDTETEITTKEEFNQLLNLSRDHLRKDIDLCEKYLTEAKLLAKDINDIDVRIRLLSMTSIVAGYKSDYANVILSDTENLLLTEEASDYVQRSEALNRIGVAYWNLGHYDQALHYLSEAAIIMEDRGVKSVLAKVFNNIGLVYEKLMNHEKALEFHFKSLKIKEQLNSPEGISRCLLNIGNIFTRKEEYTKALDYYQKALKIKQVCSDKAGMAFCYNNIGRVLIEMGEYEEALEKFDLSLKLKTGQSDLSGIVNTKYNICNTFCHLGRHIEAAPIIEEALQSAREIKAVHLIFEGTTLYSHILGGLGRYQDAWCASEKCVELYKLLFQDSLHQQVRTIEESYTVSAKIREINILKDKATELESLNQALQEERDKINQSMNYASLIQRSILPKPGDFTRHGVEHFILWRQKDIVGGDFYWLHPLPDGYLVAVADCTGHGVPGALLTMSANSLLNNIVRDKGETGPMAMLRLLHEGICDTLRQHSDTDIKDGLTIALVKVLPKARTLTFSGAGQSLFLLTRGADNETGVTRVRGGKHGLGGISSKGPEFMEETLSLGPGDRFYLPTDGILDQKTTVNGRGVRLGTAGFEALLLELSPMSLYGQKGRLQELMNQWISEHEQRDDITVLGIEMNE